jgi:hypothetical protein
MKKTAKEPEIKEKKPAKAKRGRPKVAERQQSVTFRFDPAMIEALDAWAGDHGRMGRSSAVRLAVDNLIKGRRIGKSS